jgi:hypothetical protein
MMTAGTTCTCTPAPGRLETGRQPPRPGCISGSTNACNTALARLHFRQVVTYQPASRFWTFQWTETGMHVVLALLLTGFCIWRVNRRLIR